MTIGFAFTFHDAGGRERSTSTSRNLLSESSYPVQLSELIEQYGKLPENERQLVDGLFLRKRADTEDEGAAKDDNGVTSSAQTVQPESEIVVRTPARAFTGQPLRRQEAAGSNGAFVKRTRAPTPAPALRRGPPASREALERMTAVGIAANFGRPRSGKPEQVEGMQLSDELGPAKGERVTGKVSKLLQGYGFIESDWGASTLFFHYSEVVDRKFGEMYSEMRVSYIEGAGDRGPIATKILIRED